MLKQLAACLFSGILGGLLVLAAQDRSPWLASAGAQAPPPRGAAALPPAQRNPRRDPQLDVPREARGEADRGQALNGPAQGPALHELADLPFEEGGLTAEERVNVAVYATVNRSVAHITTRGTREAGLFSIDIPTEGSGSGSVIDQQGHILTNNHVIEGARQVAVTLSDGKLYEARFVGADPLNDIAVIRIEAPPDDLHPVEIGDSRGLRVGMRVFAIGNPFGLERTLTTGVISSLDRTLEIRDNRTIKSIIQIDAAINPGSSGGPLLDSHGRLIGINTAIASKTGQSAGVGFSIPVSIVARLLPQLISRGRVIRPEIGIAKVYQTERGLLIYRLAPGGPAERDGLRGPQTRVRRRGPFVTESEDKLSADLIIGVDGQTIQTADDFLSAIEAHQPGERVVVRVLRAGKELEIPVTLGGEEGASRGR
ncbi:MAG: S1C family serine protease [Planctomycetaceae bacterium]